MGRVKIDSKWRVVIPAEFREGLKPGDVLLVEKRGVELVFKPVSDLVKEFDEVKLYAPKELVCADAERGKHRWGGLKE